MYEAVIRSLFSIIGLAVRLDPLVESQPDRTVLRIQGDYRFDPVWTDFTLSGAGS